MQSLTKNLRHRLVRVGARPRNHLSCSRVFSFCFKSHSSHSAAFDFRAFNVCRCFQWHLFHDDGVVIFPQLSRGEESFGREQAAGKRPRYPRAQCGNQRDDLHLQHHQRQHCLGPRPRPQAPVSNHAAGSRDANLPLAEHSARSRS